MPRSSSTSIGLGILLFCLCGGCTSTKSFNVGQYARGDQALIRRAPESAVYKVQWLSADQKEKQICLDSERWVVRGEPIGFATGPDGCVTAIAGKERFPLQRLPSHARYCQWHCKIVRETRFGWSMEATADAVAGGTMLAAAVAAEAKADGLLDGSGRGSGGRSDHDRSRRRDHDDHPHSPTSKGSD